MINGKEKKVNEEGKWDLNDSLRLRNQGSPKDHKNRAP